MYLQVYTCIDMSTHVYPPPRLKAWPACLGSRFYWFLHFGLACFWLDLDFYQLGPPRSEPHQVLPPPRGTYLWSSGAPEPFQKQLKHQSIFRSISYSILSPFWPQNVSQTTKNGSQKAFFFALLFFQWNLYDSDWFLMFFQDLEALLASAGPMKYALFQKSVVSLPRVVWSHFWMLFEASGHPKSV